MYKNFSLNWGELTEKNCWLSERTEVRGLSDDLVDSMSVCLHTRYMLTTFPTMVHSIIIAKFEINFGIIRTWVGSIRLKDGIGSYKYLSTIRQLSLSDTVTKFTWTFMNYAIRSWLPQKIVCFLNKGEDIYFSLWMDGYQNSENTEC